MIEPYYKWRFLLKLRIGIVGVRAARAHPNKSWPVISFPILVGLAPRILLEDARKVALGGKTQIIRDGDGGLFGIAQKPFCLLRLFAQNEIGERHARLLPKFDGEARSAQKHRFCDLFRADGLRKMAPYIVRDVQHEFRGHSSEAKALYTLGVVEDHTVLKIRDAFKAI